MSELEENLSTVVLWIRCTFVVLCIYGAALLIAGCQVLRQWLSLKPASASRQDVTAAPAAPAAAQGKLPGSA